MTTINTYSYNTREDHHCHVMGSFVQVLKEYSNYYPEFRIIISNTTAVRSFLPQVGFESVDDLSKLCLLLLFMNLSYFTK